MEPPITDAPTRGDASLGEPPPTRHRHPELPLSLGLAPVLCALGSAHVCDNIDPGPAGGCCGVRGDSRGAQPSLAPDRLFELSFEVTQSAFLFLKEMIWQE